MISFKIKGCTVTTWKQAASMVSRWLLFSLAWERTLGKREVGCCCHGILAPLLCTTLLANVMWVWSQPVARGKIVIFLFSTYLAASLEGKEGFPIIVSPPVHFGWPDVCLNCSSLQVVWPPISSRVGEQRQSYSPRVTFLLVPTGFSVRGGNLTSDFLISSCRCLEKLWGFVGFWRVCGFWGIIFGKKKIQHGKTVLHEFTWVRLSLSTVMLVNYTKGKIQITINWHPW